ncbi:hypothetical protein BJ684DRAFT_17094, partial [Piptocephalis cylindrospora]
MESLRKHHPFTILPWFNRWLVLTPVEGTFRVEIYRPQGGKAEKTLSIPTSQDHPPQEAQLLSINLACSLPTRRYRGLSSLASPLKSRSIPWILYLGGGGIPVPGESNREALSLIRLDDLTVPQYSVFTTPWDMPDEPILGAKILDGPWVCVATSSAVLVWDPRSGSSKILPHQSICPLSFHTIQRNEPVMVQITGRNNGGYNVDTISLVSGNSLYTTRLLIPCLSEMGESETELIGMDFMVDRHGWVSDWVGWTQQGDFFYGYGAVPTGKDEKVSTVAWNFPHPPDTSMLYLGRTYRIASGQLSFLAFSRASEAESQELRSLPPGARVVGCRADPFTPEELVGPLGSVVLYESASHLLIVQDISTK